MDIQYGIKNPIFLDMKKDREYMMKEIVPWMFKYATTVGKISAMNEPAEEFLLQYTRHQPLLDIITQHFFQQTPAFFALSYLKIYLDYYYPRGGTGKFIKALLDLIDTHGGRISTSTKITAIDPDHKIVTDQDGNQYHYHRLVWAADQKTLYRLAAAHLPAKQKVSADIQGRMALLDGKRGNDSIFTLYVAVDRGRQYFGDIASEHFFYTPSRTGQSQAGPIPYNASRVEMEKWLEKYLALTTYEIACPVLRDETLAPPGKTGLIISVLFDYQLTRQVLEMGWYEEMKQFCEKRMLEILSTSIYPDLQQDVIHQFSSTPLTMEQLTGNFEGAITGWSFTNHPLPAESRLPRIMNAIKTPIPGVYQAGQWTYSPSGLPISILTGKIAADRVIKDLKTKK
jgi:phytoene dehydrogenase-like protein